LIASSAPAAQLATYPNEYSELSRPRPAHTT
jgi:hypothetical protein